MSIKHVRLKDEILEDAGLSTEKNVVLGAIMDDSDDSIRVLRTFGPDHPLSEGRAWIWKSEYETLGHGSVIHPEEVLYDNRSEQDIRVADATGIFGTSGEGSGITGSTTTEDPGSGTFVITLTAETTQELHDILDVLNGYSLLDNAVVTMK